MGRRNDVDGGVGPWIEVMSDVSTGTADVTDVTGLRGCCCPGPRGSHPFFVFLARQPPARHSHRIDPRASTRA